jgi:hypothetical protein
MSVGAIVAIVVVLVILAVLAALASRMFARRSAERRSYGPEYDRLAEEVGPRKANAEFDKRRQHVDGLGLKPLTDERRALYSSQWALAQETFIDNPVESVRTASGLVTAVAADRGYKVTDPGELQSDLSVYYGGRLDGYRSALAITERADSGATEQLRQALLDYRALFNDLAEVTDDAPAATTAAAGTAAASTAPATGPAQPVAPPVAPAGPVAPVTDTVNATPENVAPATTEDTGTAHHRVFWRRESDETSSAASRP